MNMHDAIERLVRYECVRLPGQTWTVYYEQDDDTWSYVASPGGRHIMGDFRTDTGTVFLPGEVPNGQSILDEIEAISEHVSRQFQNWKDPHNGQEDESNG